MEGILAEENISLKKTVPGILQSREHRVGVHIITFDELKGYVATGLCGVYLTMSNRGMKYILVLYNYGSNLIAARSMKSNKGAAITNAYNSMYAELKEASITPILYKTSKELILAMKKNNLKYQLVAPHNH